MAQGSAVARRYARALLEVAAKNGVVAEVGRDLAAVAEALWGDEALRSYFLGTRVSPQAKKNLVSRLADERVHRLVRNFLLLVVDKRREALLPEMARLYSALEDRFRGVSNVRVRTAVPLDESERAKVETILAAKLGRPVRLSFATDPDLLGGVEVRTDDRLYDASLRRRLQRLGEHLAKAR
ncbi:MAG: ATP synthase F1 subunit delta [Bacillota bacterium]